MNRLTKGVMIAGAAAALVIAGNVGARAASHAESGGDEVKCSGVNECKGKGACSTAEHDCAGKNECKGKGWIKLSKADCEEKGGTVVEKKQ